MAGIPAGVGVVKLTAAGNAVWCDYGPDFIFNRLEVSGPDERLYDFIGAASGPGFVGSVLISRTLPLRRLAAGVARRL